MADTRSHPAAILLRAAKRCDAGQPLASKDVRDINAYIELRALDAANIDPDAGFEIDEHHPGYLKRTVGDDTVFIPFNLAPVSPDEAQLFAAIEIGRAIQLAPRNTFCLSGSATFMGAVPVGADLDFCEYLIGDCDALRPAIEAKTIVEEIPLIVIKAGAKKVKPPWRKLAAALDPWPERLKMDFVSRSDFGTLPTTSLCLRTQTGEDGEAHRSFAYQEAVVLGAGPIRALVSLERLGSYIIWLRGQIRTLLDGGDAHAGAGAPVKALKRCLSLFLMLAEPDDIEAIVKRLQASNLAEVVREARIAELETMAKDMRKPPQWLTQAIADLRAERVMTDEERAPALQATAEMAEALYSRIDVLFREAA